MLTLTLLLAMPLQDDAKVTLDLPISPLPAIFKQIEAQTGYVYQVTGPNRNQQIFIRVKDMPSARLREAIAKVTEGTWTQAGSTWALITRNDVSVRETAYRKSVSGWFAKQKPVAAMNRAGLEANLKRSAELVKLAENDSSKMAELYSLGRHAPKNRLASRIIQGIGLNEALSISDKERRVYAFNPTSLQKALPASAGNALSEYKREQAEYQDSVSRLFPAPIDGDDEQFLGWNPLIDPYRQSRPTAPPATLMLALHRVRGTLSYTLQIYDAKGARIDTEGGTLSGEMDEMIAGGMDEMKFHDGFKGLEMPVNLSPEDKQFAKDIKNHLFGGMMMEGPESKDPISEVTKQRLLNMDKVDPLTYGPTQMLQQFADVKKKQVVAKVTDLAIFSVSFGVDMEKPATLASAVSLALGAYGGSFDGLQESDDLVTLKPTQSEMIPFPIEMDRNLTAQFLRSVAAGQDPLETVSVLAAKADSAEDIQLPILMSLLFSSEASLFFAQQGFDLIKLYGQLNPAQKAMAKQNGLVIPLGSMVGPMAIHARQMLLANEGNSAMETAAPMADSASPDFEDALEGVHQSGTSYNDEITVKLANLPAGSGRLVISLTGKRELFMITGASTFATTNVANPSMAAYSLLQAEQNPSEQYMKLKGFSYGIQRTLSAKFQFGDTLVHSSSIEVPLLDKGVNVMKLSDLPAEFQKEVQDQLAIYRKEMQAYPPNGGGGGAAKPPQH